MAREHSGDPRPVRRDAELRQRTATHCEVRDIQTPADLIHAHQRSALTRHDDRVTPRAQRSLHPRIVVEVELLQPASALHRMTRPRSVRTQTAAPSSETAAQRRPRPPAAGPGTAFAAVPAAASIRRSTGRSRAGPPRAPRPRPGPCLPRRPRRPRPIRARRTGSRGPARRHRGRAVLRAARPPLRRSRARLARCPGRMHLRTARRGVPLSSTKVGAHRSLAHRSRRRRRRCSRRPAAARRPSTRSALRECYPL